MRNKSVLFIFCANNYENGRRLVHLTSERTDIINLFDNQQEQGDLDVISEGNTSRLLFFSELRKSRYRDRECIIHFAGHANGNQLRMESRLGEEEIISEDQLTGFLKTIKNLKLVFLNGCGTYPLVNSLLKSNVPAVLATKRSIDDSLAAEFAIEFYKSLSQSYSIKESFYQAKSIIQNQLPSKSITLRKGTEIIQYSERSNRDVLEKKSQDEDFPWGLYYLEEREEILNWSLLPTKDERKARKFSKYMRNLSVMVGVIILFLSNIDRFSFNFGNKYIPSKEIIIEEFKNGFIFENSGKYGLYDRNKIKLTEAIYDSIKTFYNEIAIIKRKNLVGYIDLAGNEVTEVIYDNGQPFGLEFIGLASVELNGESFYIDINGKRKDKPLTLNSDINIEMVPVVGGTFNIGSQNGPQIQLSPFSISRYEITQKQYLSVMGERNPSEFQDINCPNCPVENVTWNEAKDFTEKLSLLSDKKFRLPTEAEWEYVATGGKNRDTYTYSGTNYIDEAAWYLDNSGGTTHPVGRKVSNSLGIYDMSGNVWEWVLDWKADINLLSRVNPTGPKTGIKKVVRGCSWNDQAGGCTTFFRGECPTSTRRGLGIRVVSDY